MTTAPQSSANRVSAGIVLVRWARPADREGAARAELAELLLVHPGGPFWKNKDEHAWSIPKGEADESEALEEAAVREFAEELGSPVPGSPRHRLPPFKAGRKTIHSWLVVGDLDVTTIVSNTTEIEWPPRSGQKVEIPEVDRAAWVPLPHATAKLHKGQAPLVALVTTALETLES